MEEITKAKAREFLEKMILDMVYMNPLTQEMDISLPIFDVNINSISMPNPKIAKTLQELDDLNNRPLIINRYSFREILKIAYDLEDKK